MTEDEADADDTRQMLLDLFTEIAILEHLLRLRFEPRHYKDLSAADFGLLNHFCRLKKTESKLSGIAWSFQVEVAHMRATVEGLAARGLVTVDAETDPCVRITDAGKQAHAETIAEMAPDIAPIMSEFDLEDLKTTTRTLMEIRRTFDNLPDR